MADALLYILLVFLFYGLAIARTNLLNDSQNDVFPSVPIEENGICKERVEIYGYVCEEHTVTTEDGYILSLQRIPVGRSNETSENRPPVLLQHGVLMDGITWLLNTPDQSLAYILIDNGFDVWISNTRGTKYSRGHTALSADDPAYWEWSWDQLVQYDLPSTVEYVHNKTGQQLHYVGHSLGTLIALASFSQEKLLGMIRSAALLSPVAYLRQMSSPIVQVAVENFLAEKLYQAGALEFNPKDETITNFLKSVCNDQGVNCFNLITSFTGNTNLPQISSSVFFILMIRFSFEGVNCCLNSSTMEVFIEHEPQSTATKNMIHLAQMIREGTIAMFDYGDSIENMKHYGKYKPPAYDMTRIPQDFPLFLSYGGEDVLADPNDVQVLLDDLKDHDEDKLVIQYTEEYAHADFVMGVNAKQVIYDRLTDFFRFQ